MVLVLTDIDKVLLRSTMSMVLTDVDKLLLEHIKDLFAYKRKNSVTLTMLARWSVDTALEHKLLAIFVEPDDLLDRTEDAMRKRLASLEDPRRYFDGRKDPTLTTQGMNWLLMNDNHPLAVQYRSIVCELAPHLAEHMSHIWEEFKKRKRAETQTPADKVLGK
jgi:hypothetical protein